MRKLIKLGYLTLLLISALFLINQAAMSEYLTKAKLIINLDAQAPENSFGLIYANNQQHQFPVGSGRKGTIPAGTRFKDEYSLLGDFRVSGILSAERFELAPDILKISNKPVEYLKDNLFKSMNAIDFDDDGMAGEYGAAYIGLTPIDSNPQSSNPQPFTFGEYKGKYRWYNYAIHGTNDESRIGKRSTGGCINVSAETLQLLLAEVKVGDIVTVQEK